MNNVILPKQLYYLQWWGFDDYPCSKFLVAESTEQAMEMVQGEMKEKNLPCNNLNVVCVCFVDEFEIKPTKEQEVQRKIDDGCIMPYCKCGYGLCFDDVFCRRCGGRLNWEPFWDNE